MSSGKTIKNRQAWLVTKYGFVSFNSYRMSIKAIDFWCWIAPQSTKISTVSLGFCSEDIAFPFPETPSKFTPRPLRFATLAPLKATWCGKHFARKVPVQSGISLPFKIHTSRFGRISCKTLFKLPRPSQSDSFLKLDHYMACKRIARKLQWVFWGLIVNFSKLKSTNAGHNMQIS